VLDATASNIDDFLLRDTCVSSTQPKRPFWRKQSLSPPEIPKFQEEFLSKTTSILKGNSVQEAPASNTDSFLLRDACVSSTQLNRPNWSNVSLTPP
jgi:hypothetical protein